MLVEFVSCEWHGVRQEPCTHNTTPSGGNDDHPPALRALKFLALCALAFPSFPGHSQEAPEPPAVPDTRPIVSDGLPDMSDFPPVYLYKDIDGREFTLQFPGSVEENAALPLRAQRRYLGESDRAFLARIKARVRYIVIGRGPKYAPPIDTCAYQDPPGSFTLVGGNGGPLGALALCLPNGRNPAGAHTQWTQFIVATYNFSTNQTHIAVPLWFKSTIHGHGIYFGDSSALPCSNGANAGFNTRIEAWSQWQGFEPVDHSPQSPYWGSTGDSLNMTCGIGWQDGYYRNAQERVVDTGLRFRITIHADDSQAVMYSVDRRYWANAWVTHTPAVWRNVTYASQWPSGYGSFDTTANGLAFIAAGPAWPIRGNWFVSVSGLTSGWF